jgi:hypothetical protein
MPNRRLRLAWIAPMIALAATPVRAQFCYVSYASGAGQGVELHFTLGSNVFVRISKAGRDVAPADRMYQQEGAQMHRLQPNAQGPDVAVSKVVLFRGERAFVSNSPHSACTILPSGEGSVAGVIMKASVSLPGIPTQVTTRFLPLGVHQDNDADPAVGDAGHLK